jgi:hypothetical protein
MIIRVVGVYVAPTVNPESKKKRTPATPPPYWYPSKPYGVAFALVEKWNIRPFAFFFQALLNSMKELVRL